MVVLNVVGSVYTVHAVSAHSEENVNVIHLLCVYVLVNIAAVVLFLCLFCITSAYVWERERERLCA